MQLPCRRRVAKGELREELCQVKKMERTLEGWTIVASWTCVSPTLEGRLCDGCRRRMDGWMVVFVFWR